MQNVTAGAMFMKSLAPSVTVFHLSGNTDDIEEFVASPESQMNYPFLLADVAPNVKAYQFIISRVSY